MALEKKGSTIVVPAIRVADLPALPDDISDSAGMGKWWNDFRQVLARLIQSRSDTTQAQPSQSSSIVVEQPAAQESKPVDWDSIINKPEKFPPAEHAHATPWFQVEEPLSLGEIDPATNLATLGFHEQKAGHFLAGPLSGPVAKPVFRPLYSGDDGNINGAGGGTPGTLDDLNGITGAGTPNGTVAVQSRGGAWTLVGYPEFNIGATLATMPPPRYRLLTRAGSVRTDYYQWGDNGCGSPNGYYRLATWAGSCQYSASTGALSGSAARTDRAPDGSTTVVQLGCVYESGIGDGFAPISHTRAETTPQSCVYTESNPYGSYARSTGIGTVDLSDPDLPSAAQARMLAAAEWAGSVTTAISTVPTTGITGIYRKLRYRTEHTAAANSSHWVFGAWVDGVWVPGHSVTVSEQTVYPTLTGLAIWARYRLRIVLQKRAVDSAGAPTGDYATAETVYSAPFTTDLNGEGGVDWVEIEPEDGYETAIQSATPELY